MWTKFVSASGLMKQPMPATLEQSAAKTASARSTFIFRFVSTIVLWSIALVIAFSGYEIAFWVLISAFGLIALWEFYRHARSQAVCRISR